MRVGILLRKVVIRLREIRAERNKSVLKKIRLENVFRKKTEIGMSNEDEFI